LDLCFTRYFMFFLSPLLLLSRWKSPDVKRLGQQEVQELMKQTHRVPAWPANQLLNWVFSLESPLGVRVPFPWGTSVIAVLRRC
jgi:hypothetical protein